MLPLQVIDTTSSPRRYIRRHNKPSQIECQSSNKAQLWQNVSNPNCPGRRSCCSVVPVAHIAHIAPVAPGHRPTKAHKNADFVLGKPENGGLEGQKSTKTSILCSKCQKTGVQEGKSAQKCRFCAREEGDWHQGERKLASGSITWAFLQITAHASKMQIPHNQIINF